MFDTIAPKKINLFKRTSHSVIIIEQATTSLSSYEEERCLSSKILPVPPPDTFPEYVLNAKHKRHEMTPEVPTLLLSAADGIRPQNSHGGGGGGGARPAAHLNPSSFLEITALQPFRKIIRQNRMHTHRHPVRLRASEDLCSQTSGTIVITSPLHKRRSRHNASGSRRMSPRRKEEMDQPID
jgi:hypothetical protein